MSAPERTRGQLLLLAEVTLSLATVVAVFGLSRLFTDGSFLPEVVLAAVVAHVTAAVCRRRGLGAPATMLVAIVGALLLTTWTQLGDTTALGLPTVETLRQGRAAIEEAWRTFGDVVAPSPVLPGFVLTASLGTWLIAFAADAAAFRARATVEAVVPAATLFVFGGALGDGGNRVAVAATFLAAVLGHWLAQRSLAATAAPTWLAADGGGSTRSLLRAGLVIAAMGVVAAVVVGPNLPGADARAIIPWRASDRDSPDSRVTISPLVDIRRRIVDQADVEVFRVRASVRSYWRLTSLEQFDGRRWTSNRQYRPAQGTLGSDVDTSQAGFKRSVQRFTIEALSTIWLPAAFRPVSLDGTDARYDTDSNSLLTEESTAAGLTYTVESAIPAVTAEQLEQVRPVAPADVAREYTALPDDFSPEVTRLAADIVQGARTQYDRARALQDYFRSGDFVYDLDVRPGHSGDDLENFLREKRGYCEQFAGAYAAMARAVALPARVGVGFTPGERDPETGDYVVKGFNGHAWPEVFLDGYGWIAFEPTPGRGAPGAEAYTGVPESQAQPGNPNTPTTAPASTTTTAPDGSTATTAPPLPQQEEPATLNGGDGSAWPSRALAGAALLVALPLVWASVLTLLRSRRRHRRRQAAVTPGQRVLVAWDEASEALARAGTPPEPWETPDEYAARASATTGVDPRLLGGLAGLTTAVGYGPADVADAAADRASEAAGTIERAADELVGRRRRLQLWLDPRPLLPEHEARVDVRTV